MRLVKPFIEKNSSRYSASSAFNSSSCDGSSSLVIHENMTLTHPVAVREQENTKSTPLNSQATKSYITSARSQHVEGNFSSSTKQQSNMGVSLSPSQTNSIRNLNPIGVVQIQPPSKSVTSLTSQQTHSSSATSVANPPTNNRSVASLPIRRTKNGSLQSVSSFCKNNKKGLSLSDLDRTKLPHMTTSSRKIFEMFGTDPRTETAIPEAHQQHVIDGGPQISGNDTNKNTLDEYHYYLKDGDEQVVRSKPLHGVLDKESYDVTSLRAQPLMSGGLDGGQALEEAEAIGQAEKAVDEGGAEDIVEDESVVEEKVSHDGAYNDAPYKAFANEDEDSILESYLRNQRPPSLLHDHRHFVTIRVMSSSDGSSISYTMHTSFACHHSPILAQLIRRYPAGPVLIVAELECMFAFGAVQAWMYTQSTNGWRESWGEVFNWRIYMVWKLAQTLRMPALQNASMRLITTIPAPLALTNWIYDNTKTEDKLRLCFVHILARTNTTFPADQFGDQKIPAPLFIDYMNAAKSMENLTTAEREKDPDEKEFYVDIDYVSNQDSISMGVL